MSGEKESCLGRHKICLNFRRNTMLDEETTAVPPPSPERQPSQERKQQTGSKDRTPFWVLIGVVVGFMLPACSCAMFMMTAVFSTSLMGAASAPTMTGLGSGDAVAVIRVEGTILSGDGGGMGSAYSSRVIGDLETAVKDNSVKAILLYVDSPGGSVTGSAEIWEALDAIEKPIVVSMGGTAASGGYYVSAPATYIIARPDTITGSLGVILTIYDASELIEKVGVEVIYIASGDNKAMGSTWTGMTAEQEEIFYSITDEAYQDFVYVIMDGRGMSETEVRELADGRVYSGRQALDNGLVDQLGNFQDAINKAAELGGISGTPRVIEYTTPPSWTDIILGFTTAWARAKQNAP
jgi:protease IV